jgi:N-methylhydantoinase A/oxoprolinase/acetone carboxylase beta subunit
VSAPGPVGVDVGGTFTDVVTEDGRVAKVLSSSRDPARSVASALEATGTPPGLLAHGTTVATNALLERSGARVALVTNRGMADLIEIGRQNRPSLYDQWADRPAPLVPGELRVEAGGRLDARGRELEAPGPAPPLPPGAQAVAICLLHADLNGSHEHRLAAAYASFGLEVCCSSDVAPEFREFERCSTTVVNAYVRPLCRSYLLRLAELAPEVLVMTSAGGLVPLGEAAERPVALLVDPAELALVAFGGAGPLHAAPLARSLGMRAVVVPPRAGVLSAVGLLGSPRQVDLVRSWPTPWSVEGLARARAELAGAALARLPAVGGGFLDPVVESTLDCRYAGQSHELQVGELEDFEEEHRRRNGFVRPGARLEVVALRARAVARRAYDVLDLPLVPRRRVEGPCVLAEADTALWVPEGFVAELGGGGSWVLTSRGGR